LKSDIYHRIIRQILFIDFNDFITGTFWDHKFKISYCLYNKRVRPTKNEPQQGISYLEREREGVREGEMEEVRERNG
jgi:hypothetical protein